MTLKVLMQDFSRKEHATEAAFIDFDEFCRLQRALPLPPGSAFPRPRLKLESEYAPADFFSVVSTPIVSASLKDVLTEVGAEFDFVQVEVLGCDGVPCVERGFYYAHLTREVDCIDTVKSDVDIAPDGFVEEIRELVLTEEPASRTPVFWLANASLTGWVVQSWVAAKIEGSGVTGVRFVPLSEAALL